MTDNDVRGRAVPIEGIDGEVGVYRRHPNGEGLVEVSATVPDDAAVHESAYVESEWCSATGPGWRRVLDRVRRDLGADVTLGSNVHLGSGSRVGDGARIGANARIGARAVVAAGARVAVTPGSPTASSCSVTDAGRRGRTSGPRPRSAGLGLGRLRRGLDLVGLDLVDRLLDDGVGLRRAPCGSRRRPGRRPGPGARSARGRSRPGAPRPAPCGG